MTWLGSGRTPDLWMFRLLSVMADTASALLYGLLAAGIRRDFALTWIKASGRRRGGHLAGRQALHQAFAAGRQRGACEGAAESANGCVPARRDWSSGSLRRPACSSSGRSSCTAVPTLGPGLQARARTDPLTGASAAAFS